MIKSKRIASNTLVLFARMFIITVINLYAVRLLIDGLGSKEDYGIYMAVAGVVLTSQFLISVLAVSVQRFYSFSIGEKKYDNLPEIFSASLNIVIIFSILIFFFFETVGHWFLMNYMIFPENRIDTVEWIFQFSILSLIFSFLQVPYSAAIFANEDIGYYAIISSIDCLMKLTAAFFVGKIDFDGLKFYGCCISLITFIVLLIYVLVARSHYQECNYRKVTKKNIYKQLLSFSGWTMYGTISAVVMIQGSSIMLNLFFGPLANAAYGIANRVYDGINSLTNSIQLAFRPSMIKAYAEKKSLYLDNLFYVNNKFLLFILISISLPLLVEMQTILDLWLHSVSEETVLFTRLFIIYSIILSLHNPITTIVQSTGKIRNYFLFVESLTILCVPLSWFLFERNFESYAVFVSMIFVGFCAHIVRLVCLSKICKDFSISKYLLKFIIPGFLVLLLAVIIALIIHFSIDNYLLRFMVSLLVVPLSTLITAYFFGISSFERQVFHIILHNFIKK